MTVFTTQLGKENHVGYPRIRSLGMGFSPFSFTTLSLNILSSFDGKFCWSNYDFLLKCFCK